MQLDSCISKHTANAIPQSVLPVFCFLYLCSLDSEASAGAGCVDDSGTAYIWGPALRQSFGSASSEVDKPQPVPGIHHAVCLAIGGCHVLVQEHSGAVSSYGANEYGVLGHGSDSASKGMLPARIPDVQFEQVRVVTLLPCCTY